MEHPSTSATASNTSALGRLDLPRRIFRTLMPQIRARANRAIIVDTTGDMVEKFYNPETDILLNPLDVRSVSWNLFQECHTQTELEGFAEALIPSGSSQSDSFWDESSRIVFTAALNKHSETTHWISKTLGDSEIEETQENISYGANTIRDGVSLNHTKRIKPIVMPSEVAALDNLECYIKYPEGFPIAKLQVSYKELVSKSLSYSAFAA